MDTTAGRAKTVLMLRPLGLRGRIGQCVQEFIPLLRRLIKPTEKDNNMHLREFLLNWVCVRNTGCITHGVQGQSISRADCNA